MVAAQRYDALIIGAGPDGLAAAVMLARAGLSVMVTERATVSGGRAATQEFHPGFFASPYADALAPIPADIFRDLDLARLGAVPLPGYAATPSPKTERARLQCLAHALEQAGQSPRHRLLSRPRPPVPWPVPDFAQLSLAQAASPELLAETLDGRTADPFLAGSALHLLVPGGSFAMRGGLGTLGAALTTAARAAGAEVRCSLEVTDILRRQGRVSGVGLADGSTFETGAVISTLDVRRSFLSLFKWSDLSPALVATVGQYRMAGGTARLLIALKTAPTRFRGALRLHATPEHFAAAETAWRAGTTAGELPMTLRLPSAVDPGLAPAGSAVLTLTVSGVPCRPFDGAWMHDKRDQFAARLFEVAETALPGLSSQILSSTLILPPDIEEALGASEGDLLGGEIAPDQMLAFRPWNGNSGARTPIEGFYLAGPSSPAGVLGTCMGGVVAAQALLADRAGRR